MLLTQLQTNLQTSLQTQTTQKNNILSVVAVAS